MKTRTLPDSQQGAWFEGPDVVTMLRVFGTDREFELPRDKKSFTLGSSPDCDIAIPEKFLSSVHCLIARRGQGLRVHDQGSYNGTFYGGRRESVFDLRPGETFTAASIRFLALNDEMKLAYPVLADLLGSEDEHDLRTSAEFDASPSDVILAATSGTNLIILGERGCEQERLARTIHGISLLRARDVVELDRVPDDRIEQRKILDRASRSTLVLSIPAKAQGIQVVDAAFASMLFSPSYHVRVIAIAPTIARANDVIGEAHVRSMRNIVVRPFAQRPTAIPRALDRLFVERASALRFSELTASNQAALLAFLWPENFTDLRIAADRLVAIVRDRSILKASKAIGVSTSTLHYWFNQVGLSLPLVHAA